VLNGVRFDAVRAVPAEIAVLGCDIIYLIEV
jgi:hypothetical protein